MPTQQQLIMLGLAAACVAIYLKQQKDAEALARLEQFVLADHTQRNQPAPPEPDAKTYYGRGRQEDDEEDDMQDSRMTGTGGLRLGSGSNAPPRGGPVSRFDARSQQQPAQAEAPQQAVQTAQAPQQDPQFDPDEFADFLEDAPNVGLGR